jgi:chromosome segregation ATPase
LKIINYNKALEEAEKEEKMLKKAMEEAQRQIQTASNEEKLEFEAKLNELQEKLRIAEEKNQRALSMAQQTRSGHVYIISNIGSFGENIYKIGKTYILYFTIIYIKLQIIISNNSV